MNEQWEKQKEVFTVYYEIHLQDYLSEEVWQKKLEEILKPEDLLNNTERFLSFMDKQIDKEHAKPFVTNNLENAVTNFLRACIISLMQDGFEVFLELRNHRNSFDKICSHRHVGYAFYKAYTVTKAFLDDYEESAILLYNSMLEYYCKFYGSFADNEEAIELICTHYKKEWDGRIVPDKIADALKDHVQTAGGPNDKGYAFNGIELIRTHIHKIPNQAILKLLCTYKYGMYWNNDVYRNQIVSIIYGIFLEDREQAYNYKWCMLDARFIMHMVTLWIEIYMLPEFKESYRKLYESSIDATEISVLTSKNNSDKCEQEVRWQLVTQENVEAWSLVLEDSELETTLLTISLEVQENSACSKIELFGCDGNKASEYEFPFDFKDWQMYDMKPLVKRNKIAEWLECNVNGSNFSRIVNTNDITSDNPPSDEFNYSILISNIWLNNYRTIKEKTMSFDGEYNIENNSGQLVVSDNAQFKKIPEHLFGKNIYSLSAIIGKNGSGKTTIVDFIKDNFYQLLYLINVGLVESVNNVVPHNLAIPHDAEFMVIFKIKSNNPSIQEETYYLTNCEHDCSRASNLTAYKKTLSSSAMIETCSKTFYFSNMFSDKDTFNIQERDNYIQSLHLEFSKKELEDKHAQFEKLKDIRGRYTCNCSVDYSFQQKLSIARKWDYNDIDLYHSLIYNWEWVKLVYFLCNVPDKKFKQWFDYKLEKENITFYRANRVETIKLNYNEGVEGAFQMLEPYIRKPIEICGLSSGQYAKLMYLSRLCWSLRAYETDRTVIERMLKELYNNDNVDTSEQKSKYSEIDILSLLQDSDVIVKGNAYMIFIDEGELYYHPEWQRTFIKTLLDVIGDAVAREDSIAFQVVITSNSPFIISDIPMSNILFLSEDKQKFENTFGLNIHTLLVDNFFMDGTIGEFAREKIKEISDDITELAPVEKDIDELKMSEEDKNHSLDFESGKDILMKIQERINLVGEPLIRRQLQKRLDSIKKMKWAKLQAEEKRKAIIDNLSKEELSKLYEQIGQELKSGGEEEHDKD